MKNSIALVTDSAANLPAEVAGELGILVAPGSYAFDDERVVEQASALPKMFERMRETGEAPRTFGPTEAAWTGAFLAGLERADSVLCLVTPFDVSSSFTTASAAMLAIQFDRPEARIKVVNPGVGSVGLASLLTSLSQCAGTQRIEDALESIEALEPASDALFVPGSTAWLERSGRLALIEERLGELDGACPVLRAGTRLTGVSRAETFDDALQAAATAVAVRAGLGRPLVVTIAHADAPASADRAVELVGAGHPGARVVVSNLAATIGAQLGPGTVGIGVAPGRV